MPVFVDYLVALLLLVGAAFALVVGELTAAVVWQHVSILETLIPLLSILWVAGMKQIFASLPRIQVGLALCVLVGTMFLIHWGAAQDPQALFFFDFILPLAVTAVVSAERDQRGAGAGGFFPESEHQS